MRKKPDTTQTCTTPGCTKPGVRAIRTSPKCHTCHTHDLMSLRAAKVAAGLKEPFIIPTKYNTDQHGYRLGYAPEHPLASKTGLVTEHRVVAYTKYGPGPHDCHWCKTSLNWSLIEVDHLDWTRDNNHPDNLVVSCKTCNCSRTKHGNLLKTVTVSSEAVVKMMALAKRLGN